MGQSHKRRREARRTLQGLSTMAGKIVDETAAAAGHALAPQLRERIAGEIVAYTDPWYFAGRDAAIDV